ncbi:hypothetical protein NXX23_18645 [Bacteroides ovatus]|nr:hypothetical protein [Bacteroides ovatus]
MTLQIKVALRSIDAHILYFPVKQFNIAVVGKAQCLQSPAFLLDFRFVVWFAPRGDDHFPRHAGIDLAEGNQLPVFLAVPFFQLVPIRAVLTNSYTSSPPIGNASTRTPSAPSISRNAPSLFIFKARCPHNGTPHLQPG